VTSFEQRLAALESALPALDLEHIRRLSDAELDERIRDLVARSEAHGWARDDVTRSTLCIMKRAAEREAERDPTPERLAAAEHWRMRLAEASEPQ
jgi:hypothetical protein